MHLYAKSKVGRGVNTPYTKVQNLRAFKIKTNANLNPNIV